MEPTDFQVLHEMAETDKGVYVFPLTNIKKIKEGKDGWGHITIAVDEETLENIRNNKFIGGLYLANKEEFFKKINEMIEK